MKTLIVVVVLVVLAAGGYYWSTRSNSSGTAAAATSPGGPPAPGAGGGRGRGRAALTVDTAVAGRHEIIEHLTVVGNLIGQTTVDIVPRTAGRIDSVAVKLGDRVARGQVIAKIEDREIQQQVKQAEKNLEVNAATVKQRESDQQLRKSSFARLQDLFTRGGLTTKQSLEDAEAAYNSSISAVDLAKAQLGQTQARLEELKINLSNTNILSPVDGFVSRRLLDTGAFAGGNTVILSVVEISTVRLVASLVERDFRRVKAGVEAVVSVDAFPGEQFSGVVSRVAPVFDSATRTATMEIEVPNPGFRLKPGMYARVELTVDRRPDALTVPRNAVVDLEGKRGVYLVDGTVARYHAVRTGLQDNERIEVLEGLTEGQRVVTTGALALRDGDAIVPLGAGGRGGRRGGQPGGGTPPAGGK